MPAGCSAGAAPLRCVPAARGSVAGIDHREREVLAGLWARSGAVPGGLLRSLWRLVCFGRRFAAQRDLR